MSLFNQIRCMLRTIVNILRSDRAEIEIQENKRPFETLSKIILRGKVYLLERHFTGSRDVKDAVSEAVKNEAMRECVNRENA